MKITRGIEIHHDGDLPARSGMGSSSAFTVGLLHALHALKGRMPGKERLAKEAIHIEQNLLKEAVGSQDQVLATFGGLNRVTFLRNGEFIASPIIVPQKRIRELAAHLMLFYTGIKRTASDIASTFVHNLKGRQGPLSIIQGMVEEAVTILAGKGNLSEFGKLMREGWKVKRELSPKVSNPHIEQLYNAAISAGALGGKLTGAGGGGFLLLFVPPGRQVSVRKRLSKLIHVPFGFDFGGSQIIFHDLEQDYAASERERSKRGIRHFQELAEME
jgi:D-glycero-alpha-D-manno-heptose-7-phosphate kinase